ncbi:unnamed protein product [Rangifer tarandus platyrhynchus]|uniref:Uncharacterized protein n=1 Tax=Rangifer tarandus platyrhynchus TaxID=3082113 RepID=A0AC59YWM8_RANTA
MPRLPQSLRQTQRSSDPPGLAPGLFSSRLPAPPFVGLCFWTQALKHAMISRMIHLSPSVEPGPCLSKSLFGSRMCHRLGLVCFPPLWQLPMRWVCFFCDFTSRKQDPHLQNGCWSGSEIVPVKCLLHGRRQGSSLSGWSPSALPALPELLMTVSQGPSLNSSSQPLINTQNDSLNYLSPLVDILNEMGPKHHQISREMQVKTTMSYHPLPVRIAIIKKTKDNESWQGRGKKGNSCALLAGMSTGAATVENSMEASQKIKNRATIWFSNSPYGYVSKGNETSISKSHLESHVYHSITYNSQDMETV